MLSQKCGNAGNKPECGISRTIAGRFQDTYANDTLWASNLLVLLYPSGGAIVPCCHHPKGLAIIEDGTTLHCTFKKADMYLAT